MCTTSMDSDSDFNVTQAVSEYRAADEKKFQQDKEMNRFTGIYGARLDEGASDESRPGQTRKRAGINP
jgi:hypothetical protein